ncbi:MAG: bifunctional UDP-2,4-diacetamido-2,4,6-trideoxy-beta-L-altropyranose hydrolase/GNAT family N-acetyltransferase [Acidimicrobiales bacterium]
MGRPPWSAGPSRPPGTSATRRPASPSSPPRPTSTARRRGGSSTGTTSAPRAAPGSHLARIDDDGRSPVVDAEVLLDQNLGATAGAYPGTGADLLLGPRYALLRRDLVAAAAGRRPGTVRSGAAGGGTAPLRVVVAMGGAPSAEVRAFFEAVVASLAADDLSIRVLDGRADAAAELAAADLAVAAAGSTCWELGLLAVPSVVVSVAPNQEPLARRLGERGAARDLGDLTTLIPEEVALEVRRLVASPSDRAALSRAIAALVDGRGAARVATRLRSGLLAMRPVGPGDVRTVHELNDDPAVRAVSWSSEPIPWADHERWFAARLADPRSHLYLGHAPDGSLVGLVRFQVEARVATIGVVAHASQRGRGWGAALIDAGVRRLEADLGAGGGIEPMVRIDALVKPGNEASSRAFLDADFDPEPSGDPDVLRYARPHGRRADG